MLSVWAGLQNGPLVPEAITNVTSFGAGNGCLRCGAWESGPGFKEKEDEPRRTRRSTKKIQLRMDFLFGNRVLRGSRLCEKPLLARDSWSLAATIVQTIAPLSAAAS